MAVIFLMGFFLDFVEITIIVIPIVGPVLLRWASTRSGSAC
jgi:TRAP-type mannitol/chloroaromatic compound transport system permease large subunit